jgi:hypothetical protein
MKENNMNQIAKLAERFVEKGFSPEQALECAKRAVRKERRRLARRAMAEAMDSVGMVRVRGNLGGVYWE